eukprot:scaffold1341_cov178-Amphora_coffeaeformis.AAC.25
MYQLIAPFGCLKTATCTLVNGKKKVPMDIRLKMDLAFRTIIFRINAKAFCTLAVGKMVLWKERENCFGYVNPKRGKTITFLVHASPNATKILDGKYKNGIKSGGAAVVTLKDGMSRQGPWKNGEPVGDWYDHEYDQESLTDGSQVGAVARALRAVAAKQEPM